MSAFSSPALAAAATFGAASAGAGPTSTNKPPASATRARLKAFRNGEPWYGARPVRFFSAHSANQKAATATSVKVKMNPLRDMPTLSYAICGP